MKIKSLAIIAMSALSLSSVSALAASTIVNGGEIHFRGEVVSAACAINAASLDQTVQLGQVRSDQLGTTGNISTNVGFTIQLDDCDVSVATKAAVAFIGTTVSGQPKILALQNSAAGSAVNVGIQITDRTGTALVLDGTDFGASTMLNAGTNIIPLQAHYIATGVATAGIANADVTFKVQYQ
ncbi:fimbrial protein [Enterobacteriaceae bacterium ESL0689]|nr:fimbrial protein [Enterobacteriaceae bacterium ESL0689]